MSTKENITGKIFDGFEWQDCQGMCSGCGYRFFDYFKKTKKSFEYCLGFGEASGEFNQFASALAMLHLNKKETLVIGFECPECFTKSLFHCPEYWIEDFGKWIEYWINNRVE